jgi:hypothetical protein
MFYNTVERGKWASACHICRDAAAASAAAEAEGQEAAEARESATRSVYERALRRLRATQPDAKEEAVMLLQAWLAFEQATSRCAQLTAGSRHMDVTVSCRYYGSTLAHALPAAAATLGVCPQERLTDLVTLVCHPQAGGAAARGGGGGGEEDATGRQAQAPGRHRGRHRRGHGGVPGATGRLPTNPPCSGAA